MSIKELNQKTIAIIGLGSEHAAMIEYLRKSGLTAPITIFETKSQKELTSKYPNFIKIKNLSWLKDTRNFNVLKNYSLIFKSPGAHFPPILRKRLANNKTSIISPMQLFLELSPSKNTIGVTGTKGKGSTSSLIAHILKKAKKRVWLGGNIGVAPFIFINKIKKNDWIVLELSSFQLEDMTGPLKIAVLTNFSPEHLYPADPNNPNHHPSLNHYWQSKLAIARAQKKNHVFIVNKKLKNKINKLKLAGKIIYFTKSKIKSNLAGEHNKENIAAAVLACSQAKVKMSDIIKGIANFQGLEHRLEKVAIKKGVEYYNDSFATIPESTQIALKSFSSPIILLASGAEKKSDFSKLAKDIVKKVKYLILFKGQATPRFKKEVIKAGFKKENIVEVDNMKKAVTISQRQAKSGDVVILSPACASFGIFKNYKDRGQQFKQSVLRL